MSPTFALREQVLNSVKEGQLYLKAGDIDEGSGLMKDVVILDVSDPSRRRTIYADHGTLSLARNQRDLDMTLYDGVMMEVPNNKPGELTRLFYKRDRLRVKSVFSSYQQSQSGTISKGDREMSVCEMQRELARADLVVRQARFDADIAEFERAAGSRVPRPAPPVLDRWQGIGGAYCQFLTLFGVKPANAQAPTPNAQAPTPNAQAPTPNAQAPTPDAQAPTPTARRLGRPALDTTTLAPDQEGYRARIQEAQFRMEEARRQRNRYDVEIQKKFSLAAACVVFVLIGAPVALRFPRGGVGLVIGVSFAIFGLYYVGLIGGETLADKGYLPPWVAMWIANILLLAIGLALAARMGRESATTRGGDFTELLVTARARIFGWMRRVGVPVERRRG